jgi:hypothetical protein
VSRGSLEQCVESLLKRSERYGFSYVYLRGQPTDMDPIVTRLAGTQQR